MNVRPMRWIHQSDNGMIHVTWEIHNFTHFWFHVGGEVFSLTCVAGDLLSVPANTTHWFDLGPNPHVKAIRIFIDPAGWVANYTESGVDAKYNPKYSK